jgi:uncharacterized repeat protein (TIGR02543 family)
VSVDALDGLPCRVGQPDEGLVTLTYGTADNAARPITLSCAATNLFTLSVTKEGAGTVTGGAINCGNTCSSGIPPGGEVTLTATAGFGYQFTGWSGDCTGMSTCRVSMTADRTVKATFTPVYRLSVSVSVGDTTFGAGENGRVTASPSGLSPNPCGRDTSGGINCSGLYLEGTVVTLSTGGTGQFTGWAGDCSGIGTCQVTMLGNRSVSARFN